LFEVGALRTARRCTLRTYVTLEAALLNRDGDTHHWDKTTGLGVSAQVFHPGSSSFRQSVGELAPSGLRMSVKQALTSEPSEIAV
jgi:hypothetical protein